MKLGAERLVIILGGISIMLLIAVIAVIYNAHFVQPDIIKSLKQANTKFEQTVKDQQGTISILEKQITLMQKELRDPKRKLAKKPKK
jgi:formate hydrogenlyase subunit 4